MKVKSRLLLFLALAFVCIEAQAFLESMELSGGAGQVDSELVESPTDSSFASLGHWFSGHVGLDVGYSQLGKNVEVTSFQNNAISSSNTTASSDSVNISSLSSIHLNLLFRFTPFSWMVTDFKLGVISTQISAPSEILEKFPDNSNSTQIGLEINYPFTRQFMAYLGYTQMQKHIVLGDAEYYVVGMKYAFKSYAPTPIEKKAPAKRLTRSERNQQILQHLDNILTEQSTEEKKEEKVLRLSP